MKLLELHKQKYDIFDYKKATLEQLEKHFHTIAVVESNNIYPNINFWSENLGSITTQIIEKIKELYTDDIPYKQRYKLWLKEIYYNRILEKKVYDYIEPYEKQEYLNELLQILQLIELSFTDTNNAIDTVDSIIDHIEISNKIIKIKLLMATQGVRMSIQQSNRIHDEQVNKMNELVFLLKTKKDLLVKSVKNKRGIDKIDTQIEVFELENSIKNKEYYISQYDKRRPKKSPEN